MAGGTVTIKGTLTGSLTKRHDLKGNLSVPSQRSGTDDYEQLRNHPEINERVVIGKKTGKEYSLQDLLIAGENIEIVDNGDHTATIRSLGGTGRLTEPLLVSNPIGRYKMDDEIPEGTSFEQIFKGLLSKTYYPTLTDPSLAITYNPPALMKVGTPVPAQKATLVFDRGSINPQYTAESPYRAGAAGRYQVSLVGADRQWTDSNASGQFDVPTFTRETGGNVNLMAWAYYVEGPQPKDSDGNDYQSPLPAGYSRANKVIEFIVPFYYGKSATRDVSSLAGLTEDLTRKGQKTYTFITDNEYYVLAYSSAYGSLKSIIDENGFENIDGWSKEVKTIDGRQYNIYTPEFATTGEMTFTFKF